MKRDLMEGIYMQKVAGKVIFDVGANDGKTFYNEARQGAAVFLFEPTPFLVEGIRRWIGECPTMSLVEMAVSEKDGCMKFNVAGQGDWGCSSLLEFSDGLEGTWPGREDFKVTEQLSVNTTRLDTFLEKNPQITKIDYLHIDTQGSDLSVLRSLGNKISLVEEGVVEVPQSEEVMLYKGQHTKEEMLNFLNANGFEVVEVISQMNEDNIRFRKRSS
jgi:FkbM family methyltransferase